MPFDLSHLVVAILAALGGAWWVRRRQPRDSYGITDIDPTVASEQVAEGPPKLPFVARLFTIVFTGGWLIAWSAGILIAFGSLVSGAGSANLFMIGWLIAAVAAWFAVVYHLIQLILGKAPGDIRQR